VLTEKAAGPSQLLTADSGGTVEQEKSVDYVSQQIC